MKLTLLNIVGKNKLLLLLVLTLANVAVNGEPDVSLFNFQRFYVKNYYPYNQDYCYRWNYLATAWQCNGYDGVTGACVSGYYYTYNTYYTECEDDLYTINFKFGFCRDIKNCNKNNSILNYGSSGYGDSNGSDYSTYNSNTWLLSVTRKATDTTVNSVFSNYVEDPRQYKYFYQYFPTMKAKYDTAYVMFNIKPTCYYPSTDSNDNNSSNNTPTIREAAIRFFYKNDYYLDMNGEPTYNDAWNFYQNLEDDSYYAGYYKVLYIPGHPLYSDYVSASFSYLTHNPSYVRSEDYINGNLCMTCASYYFPSY